MSQNIMAVKCHPERFSGARGNGSNLLYGTSHDRSEACESHASCVHHINSRGGCKPGSVSLQTALGGGQRLDHFSLLFLKKALPTEKKVKNRRQG